MNRSNETWVRNMCQKLEDMFTDIDEFVCKEPVSFVGNQMETVGANVKNFFSGFVDDFGLTQVAGPSNCINLVETSPNSVVEIKENTVDSNTNNPKEAAFLIKELCHKPSSTGLPHSELITSEISQRLIGERGSLLNKTPDNSHNTAQVNLNSSTNSLYFDNRFEERVFYDESFHSDASVFEYSDWGIENIFDLNLDFDNIIEGETLMNLEEKKTVLNDEFEFDLNTSITHQSSELESSVTCNGNQDENSKHIIAGGLSSENVYESLNSSFRNFTVEPDTNDCNPTETVNYFSVPSDVLSSCGSFTTLSCDSHNEADVSCSGTGLADGSAVEFEDVKKDAVDFEDVKKDAVDGCVISGKLSSFPNTSRSKSYKKMIQDAFMSRKRLTKEYKQLAIWYGDIDKELCQPTESQSSKTPTSPAQDLPDSEWELL